MLAIPTRNPNKWWIPILETTHDVQPPILNSQRLSLRCNAALLQNQGDCNILLDNGLTLEPGQSYEFGNHQDINTVIFETTVRFIDSTAPDPDNPTRRLEITQMIVKLTNQGYYIDQPVLNPA